mmetsp:Transcript_13022/g.26684  ORF Transcript_13022/g.26684 Transcript_13022/m.26684 type:complete len:924 (+) Transcript_13022:121-2892(+)
MADDKPMEGPGEGLDLPPNDEEMAPPQTMEDEQGEGGAPNVGVEFEDEDAYLEQDPDEAIQEFAQNPMMEGVLAALYDQLKRTYDRVMVEMLDRDEALRDVKADREEVGVQLYGMQQQLAKLQLTLEQAHQKFNMISENKGDAEESITKLKELHLAEKAAYDGLRKQVVKNQSELDALNETIRQVKLYNEEMKGEIAVTRRATYKAEDNVKNLETAKKDQDLYIDSLNERIKKLQADISLSEAQILAQTKQTTEAKEMLAETGAEMELIAFEKKQLMQQWKSSIIALTRRDEALSAATMALKDAQTSTKDYDTEIDGLKREILKSQAQNETFVNVKDRLEAEAKFIDDNVAKIRAEREAISARLTMLQRSMKSTLEEEVKVKARGVVIGKELGAVRQNVAVAVRERHALEEGIAVNRHEQITSNKATKNLAKQEKVLIAAVHEKEIEAADIKNELARIKVDTLNTEAHNVQLRDTMDKCVIELREKDKLIEKYQMEIRQRNDEIEKKMYRVDRLNRKYEKMLDGVEDEESMGPLEASIKSINKEIDLEDEKCEQLQKTWLRDQTLLVQTASETDGVSDKNSELRAKVNIMSQKRVRLLQDINTNEAELKALKASITVLHSDMSRLNDLIGRNGKLHDELKNSNFVTEQEFIQELKELEKEAVGMESRISEIKANKNQILDEIVEAERQVLLWEKKIQLSKETQVTLDPTASNNEAAGMQREINSMKHRLNALTREQEKMIREMERAIHKREDIAVKNRNGIKEIMPGEEILTKASLKKKLAGLRKNLKQTAKEAATYTAAATERQKQLSSLTSELERVTSDYSALESSANSLQSDINDSLYAKQRRQAALDRKQRAIQKFMSIQDGSAAPVDKEADQFAVEKRLVVAAGNMKKLQAIVGHVKGKFGHLEQVLERVGHLAVVED